MQQAVTQHAAPRVQVAGLELEFDFAVQSAHPVHAHCSVTPCTDDPDTYLIRFTAEWAGGEPFSVGELALNWQVPLIDMHGFYAGSPWLMDLVGLPFWEVHKSAAANQGIPFAALFHRSGEGRYAFGFVDQLAETDLSCTLSESSRNYHFHWRKPLPADAGRCQETFFVSCARRPWPELLALYRRAVDAEWPQPRLAVPECAYDPVFCSWTAIHHDVSQEWVLRNARLAADLGFGTWLTDDGWFTDKASFADYRYTGDWQPCAAKFPDFAGHVRAVQALGLRYVLWVGPFMVGDESWAAERYAHLLHAHDDRLHYSQLSPWYAATGALVGDLLERLIEDYRLDGLKLDFIDAVKPGARPSNADYATLGAGLYTALCEAVERIAARHPSLLIELRSRYTNLAARRYGNLYRASDVPFNFAWNRWQATMLRLLVPDRAVHLDPAIWHPQDSDENVAVHLINLVCSVPMVSIELDSYPQSHIDLVRHWIAFYQAHRQALVHGRFEPLLRLGHVPLIRFGSADETIVGVYEDFAFTLEAGPLPLWLLNATTRPYLEVLPGGIQGLHQVTRYDKFGHCLGVSLVTFPVGRLPVEAGGYLRIDAAGNA
jgi:alpha-galactosidase